MGVMWVPGDFISAPDGCHMDVTLVPHGCHMGTTRVSHWYHMGVTWVPHGCHMEVTLVSHGCHIGVSSLSNWMDIAKQNNSLCWVIVREYPFICTNIFKILFCSGIVYNKISKDCGNKSVLNSPTDTII